MLLDHQAGEAGGFRLQLGAQIAVRLARLLAGRLQALGLRSVLGGELLRETIQIALEPGEIAR